MTPLNLEQTISYLRERMPAPVDLPQLAHFCRQGKITPLFAYDRYALNFDEYYKENLGQELAFQLSGYLTALELVAVIDSEKPAIIDTATIYEYTNTTSYPLNDNTRQANKGEMVILLANDFNYNRYQRDENYSVFSDNDSVTITNNDLLFDREQLESITGDNDTTKLYARIAELESELATLKANTKSNTPADSGQGDNLLILGAVLETMIAIKPNYTQQSHITKILETYKTVGGISQSTLEKKFSQAKRYLKQCVN